MHRRWLRSVLTVFAAAIAVRALAEQRADKLYLIAVIAIIGIAAVAVGWLFAARRRQ
jgi:hypothetical protein